MAELTLPLPPAVAARVLARAVLNVRAAGGAGSGDHGHAGRPGQIGGSVTLYHGTRAENVDSIRQHGLGGAHARQESAISSANEVSLTTDPEEAAIFARNRAEESPATGRRADRPAVVEVRLPKRMITSQNGKVVWVRGAIPAQHIQGIRVLGGVGSGDHGHVGRPGTVGGSGTGLFDPAVSSGHRIGLITPEGEVRSRDVGSAHALHTLDHNQLFPGVRASAAWRFDPATGHVMWDEKPTSDDQFQVEDHLVGHQLSVRHHEVLTSSLGVTRRLGGPGSGDHGHAGRPGAVGGSGSIADKHGDRYNVDYHEPTRTYTARIPGSNNGLGREVSVGSLTLKHDKSAAMSVDVRGDYQRRGIASALYQHVENHLGRRLKPNWAQTPDGEALWKSRGAGGPGSGDHGHAGRPGVVGGSGAARVRGGLRPTTTRAIDTPDTAPRLSKLETGALGESIVTAYLKAQGFKDARSLNVKGNNFPVDLVEDHKVYEVKAGLASNGRSARQWRTTTGEPGKVEKAWLATASPSARAQWNQQKGQAIFERKAQAIRDVSRYVGHSVKGYTAGVIINMTTRTADLHLFKGFHNRIGWNSPDAKKGYVGSFRF